MSRRSLGASLAACLTCLAGPFGLPASAAGTAPANARRVGPDAALALRVRLETRAFTAGDEIRPDVELVNTSSQPVDLRYMKPWAVVPEIWEASRNTRLPNAPAFVLDQAVVPEAVRLAPHAALKLWAVPVFLDTRPRGTAWEEDQPGVVRAFWYYPGAGTYRLRYRIDLAACLPGATGTLTSNDVTITLERDLSKLGPRGDAPTQISGVLGFEAGRGYFLTVDPGGNPFGAKRVWLRLGEDKLLVRRLDGLLGQPVRAHGRLRRSTADVLPGAIPANAIVLEDFQVAPPATMAPAQVRTLVQGWYVADDLAPDGFRMRRTYIWLTGQAAPGLEYVLLLNPVRALAPPVLDAFGRLELAGFTLQAGQFRMPLSAEALEAGSELITIRRALFNESSTQIGLWRDIGLMGRGRPWPWLDVSCGVFNGEGMNVADGDHRKDLIARLVVEPAAGLALGLAHQERALGLPGPDHRRTGVSLDVPLGPVLGRAEALWGMGDGTTKLGWYAQVSGFMRPEVQLVARYEAWDPDQPRAQVQRDLTLGVNGFLGPLWGAKPSSDAKLALNLVHQAGPAGVGVAGLAMWQVMR